MDTNTILIVATAAIAIALVAFLAVSLWRNAPGKRRQRLRERFGPEYDVAVQEFGASEAERVLSARKRRVEKLNLRALDSGERSDFAAAWRRTQEHFVDRPSTAVSEAHDLVQQVMRARGYPVDDFEQRVADLSVDYGAIVQHYRAAHDLDESNRAGRANTEELRQAMMHYRALFAELLGARQAEEAAPPSRPVLSPST
jgi:FtsZ-interacting cell division protein ZipA